MPSSLIAVDLADLLYELEDLAEGIGFSTVTTGSLATALSECRRDPPDLVIVSSRLGESTGLDLLRVADEKRTPHFFLVGDRDDPLGDLPFSEIEYHPWPLDTGRLRDRMASVYREARRGEYTQHGEEQESFESMVGESEPMKLLFEQLEKVAATDATVLITGESGTGKELVARATWSLSPRRDGPFVPINCGAVPSELIDSELFGHTKGAFTGAHRSRKGAFERAQGGVLFLDEISEMPIQLQVRLLRVLEARSIRRVGGADVVPVDCRVVAATNRSPLEAIRGGELREDLYYRLAEFPIEVPPLRDREDDLELLALHFLAEFCERSGTTKSFRPEAMDLIRRFHWPGNVRQLKHAIRRAFILSDREIHARALPAHLSWRAHLPQPLVEVEIGASIEDAERQLIEATLAHLEGDKKKAAHTLGISLRTLYNRLAAYEEIPPDR